MGINIKPLLSVSLTSTSKLELNHDTNNAIKPLSCDNISKAENTSPPKLSTLTNQSIAPSISLKIPLNITKGGSDDTHLLDQSDKMNLPIISTSNDGIEDDMAYRRDKIKLYHSDELHTLILQILVLLSINAKAAHWIHDIALDYQ